MTPETPTTPEVKRVQLGARGDYCDKCGDVIPPYRNVWTWTTPYRVFCSARCEEAAR